MEEIEPLSISFPIVALAWSSLRNLLAWLALPSRHHYKQSQGQCICAAEICPQARHAELGAFFDSDCIFMCIESHYLINMLIAYSYVYFKIIHVEVFPERVMGCQGSTFNHSSCITCGISTEYQCHLKVLTKGRYFFKEF